MRRLQVPLGLGQVAPQNAQVCMAHRIPTVPSRACGRTTTTGVKKLTAVRTVTRVWAYRHHNPSLSRLQFALHSVRGILHSFTVWYSLLEYMIYSIINHILAASRPAFHAALFAPLGESHDDNARPSTSESPASLLSLQPDSR